jgi:hypothetical protein
MVKIAGAAANLAKKVELVKSNRVKEDVYASYHQTCQQQVSR